MLRKLVSAHKGALFLNLSFYFITRFLGRGNAEWTCCGNIFGLWLFRTYKHLLIQRSIGGSNSCPENAWKEAVVDVIKKKLSEKII